MPFSKMKERAGDWVEERISAESNRIVAAIYTAVAVIVVLILTVMAHGR
jgi:hypothetical protein